MATTQRFIGTHLPESRGGDIPTIGELLSKPLQLGDQRHPVLRTGEREPIAHHIRSAVWMRDRGKCDLCAAPAGDNWELDHIVPWSAGGSDRSANLRVLCQSHNQWRGNRVDPSERRRMPVTWWCLNCYTSARGWGSCPTHYGECAVNRGLRWAVENEASDWYSRDLIDPDESMLVTAFCAHCYAPGLTDQPL